MNARFALVLLGLFAASNAAVNYKYAQLLLFTDDQCGTSFQSAYQVFPAGQCTPPSVFSNGTTPGTDSYAAAIVSCTLTTLSINKCEKDCGYCNAGTVSYQAKDCNPFPGAPNLWFKPVCLPAFPVLPSGGQVSSFTQYASSDCAPSSLRGWFVGVQPFCYPDSLGFYSSAQCNNGLITTVSECPLTQCTAGANQTCLATQTKESDYKCIPGAKTPGAFIASCGTPYASKSGASSNAIFAPVVVLVALFSSLFL